MSHKRMVWKGKALITPQAVLPILIDVLYTGFFYALLHSQLLLDTHIEVLNFSKNVLTTEETKITSNCL